MQRALNLSFDLRKRSEHKYKILDEGKDGEEAKKERPKNMKGSRRAFFHVSNVVSTDIKNAIYALYVQKYTTVFSYCDKHMYTRAYTLCGHFRISSSTLLELKKNVAAPLHGL